MWCCLALEAAPDLNRVGYLEIEAHYSAYRHFHLHPDFCLAVGVDIPYRDPAVATNVTTSMSAYVVPLTSTSNFRFTSFATPSRPSTLQVLVSAVRFLRTPAARVRALPSSLPVIVYV